MTISKNLWKVAAVLLVMCLITAAMISGTFAKYTSTFVGEDTALVAKWSVSGTGDDFKTSGSALTLDLFQHEYDNNIKTSEGGVYIIAPGVGGDFTIQFDNDSDVAAKVDFTIATTGSAANVPIKYWFDGDITSVSAIDLADKLDIKFATIAEGNPTTTVVTQKVNWGWAFEGADVAVDDAIDTAFGTSSAAIGRTSYGLTITASAVQIAPATE